MTTTVYLVVAVPGSGKSWVCDQIKHLYTYVHHDGYIGHINQPQAYVSAIMEAAEHATKPILAEAPFSISQIKDPLEMSGFTVIPVFIIEEPHIIIDRYRHREGDKAFPGQHLARLKTYKKRCADWGSFGGTSQAVLEHLREIGAANA